MNENNNSKFAPYFENNDFTPFTLKIGGTTYEVTTHFNKDGKENILNQFMDLILNRNLI